MVVAIHLLFPSLPLEKNCHRGDTDGSGGDAGVGGCAGGDDQRGLAHCEGRNSGGGTA